MARVKSLSRSGDDTAWTDIWDCTAGTFEWRYEIDETVHILEGEPEKIITHFVNGVPSSCSGPACATCASGVKKRLSFKIPAYNFMTKKRQTLEQGIMVFKQIDKIRELYKGDISSLDFVISRSGSGQNDTKYMVISVPSEYPKDQANVPAEVIPF